MADGFNQNTNVAPQAPQQYGTPDPYLGMLQQRMLGQQGNSSTPNLSGDFSGSLNQILAPYQQMAQKMSSPYATMRPNSWLAQNHPQLAGVLDNAFLAAGSVPSPQGPEGVGGGISRAMQGLMGAQQYKRQQMMQTMMLPYQMAAGQLQAMDTASQIGERQAMLPFRQSEELKNMAYMSHWQDIDAIRAQLASQQQAVASERQSPSSLMSRQAALAVGIKPDQLDQAPPEKIQAYLDKLAQLEQQHIKATREPSQAERMVAAEEEEQTKRGFPPFTAAQRNDKIIAYDARIQGVSAGARTAAAEAVTQPPKDVNTFISQQRNEVLKNLPKVPSASDFQTAHLTDKDYWKDPQKAYQNEIKRIQGLSQQADVDLARWQKSSAPKQGVSPTEYFQNPEKYDSTAPNPAPAATAPVQPKSSSSTSKVLTFNPTTGKIE